MHKYIPGFDVLKFFMALGIVGIHSHLAQSVSIKNELWGWVISCFQNLCVPGFFIVSSFLFFRKCWGIGFKNSNNAYFKFIKRLALVYLFYFLLLFPVIIHNRGWLDLGFVVGLEIFLMDFLLRYTFPGSWFLSALMVSTTLIWLWGRCFKTYYLLVPLWFFSLYVYKTELFPEEMQILYNWYESHVRTMRLSFTAALFPVCLGSILAHPKVLFFTQRLKPYNNNLFLALILITFCLYCYKDIIGLKDILLTLIFLYSYNVDLKEKQFYYRMREYSILFFMWHFIVLEIFKVTCNKQEFDIFGIWLFFIVLAVIYLISTMILFLENKKYFNWLKYSH